MPAGGAGAQDTRWPEALGLDAQERWTEAAQVYAVILTANPESPACGVLARVPPAWAGRWTDPVAFLGSRSRLAALDGRKPPGHHNNGLSPVAHG